MIAHPLTWIFLLPTAALIALFFVPADKEALLRRISTVGTLLPLLLSIWVFFTYDQNAGGFQFIDKMPWVAPLGISYHLGVDGINALLIVLLGFGSFTAVLVSNSI